MSLNREKLFAALHAVHEELEDPGQLDADTRDHLRSALAEIRAALDAPPDSISAAGSTSLGVSPSAQDAAADDSPANRLTATARSLEETHPQLATAIGNFVDALARIGI